MTSIRSRTPGKKVRDLVAEDKPDGLTIKVTGDVGTFADFTEVFGELDVKLLLATMLLVLVLLGAIYRALLVAMSPIIVVLFRLPRLTGLHLPVRRSRARSSPRTSPGILIVLMFGVGTDYCLLLVSSYREELRRHEDKHEAMQLALHGRARRSSPAV